MLGFEHDSIYCFSHINIMVKTYCTDYSFNLINVSSAEHHILYLHDILPPQKKETRKTKGLLPSETHLR